MNYQNFAMAYDDLMYDQPYDKWLDVTAHFATGHDYLDLGAGTGSFTSLLPTDGTVVGLDLSPEMLTLAQRKSNDVHWLEGDMREFELGRTFDVVTCFCDSLNYIQSPEEVISVFNSVKKHLKSSGVFLFDVHSMYKMRTLFNNQTYSDDTDEATYIWHALEGETEGSVVHEMTFFVKRADDTYMRFDEAHEQQTFEIDTYQRMLDVAGFEVVSIFADFDYTAPVSETSERIFFVAKPKE